MSGLARALVALAVALAFSAVPLFADWCAISCEAAHSSRNVAGPTCHHGGSSALRIGHLPQPCGHNHHPTVIDATTTALLARLGVSVPASTVDSAASRVPVAAMIIPAGAGVRLSSQPFTFALSIALRI
jgi:hypothetical protein